MPDFDLQLSAVVDGVNAHSWNDVSTRLTTLESLLKASGQGIDYFNVADNGLRPGKMRSHTSPLAGRFKVRNDTGSGLSLGDLVYISGKYSDGTDTYPTVAKAVSAATTSFRAAVGVVEAAISNGADGTIARVQELVNVNTGGAAVGDPVYLSTTAGGWTLTRPTGSQITQVVGYVVEAHATTGRILVAPATVDHRFFGVTNGIGLWLDVDRNSGIYASANNEVSIQLNSTQKHVFTDTAHKVGNAATNAGAAIDFLGASTNRNWRAGNQWIGGGSIFSIGSSASVGGTDFTSPNWLLMLDGDNLRMGFSTSSPQSRFHIEVGTADVSGAPGTRSGYALLVEHDASTENGFCWADASDIHAIISATRGASSDGYLNFYTRPVGGGSITRRMRIDPDGDVIIGATAIDTALGDGGAPQKLVLWGGGGYGLMNLTTSLTSDVATSGAITFGTTGATTAGSNERRTAVITSKRQGSAGTTTTPPGTLEFLTSAGTDGVAPVQRLYIDKDGNIVVGTGALATNATNGFLLITTSAGPPTGTPTAYSGRAQLHVDTTNNRLYFWNPTGTPAWRYKTFDNT